MLLSSGSLFVSYVPSFCHDYWYYEILNSSSGRFWLIGPDDFCTGTAPPLFYLSSLLYIIYWF